MLSKENLDLSGRRRGRICACASCTARPIRPGICKAIGKVLGKEPEIILYSPEKVGTGKSGKAEGFPFR